MLKSLGGLAIAAAAAAYWGSPLLVVGEFTHAIATGELTDLFDRVLVLGVDRVGGAEALGPFELAVVDVDAETPTEQTDAEGSVRTVTATTLPIVGKSLGSTV